MAQTPTGTRFAVATAFGPSKTISSVTNALEAVVTSAAHGYAVGDIVEVSVQWGRLNLRVARIKATTTNSFTLEGMDTSNTELFTPGGGVGTVRRVNEFTPFLKVLSPSSSGGDAKQIEYKFVEDENTYSLNDGFTPTNYSVNLDADSIDQAGYKALRRLTDTQEITCLRLVSRTGAPIYQPCRVALNEAVQMQEGQINQVRVAFNGVSRLTRYASSVVGGGGGGGSTIDTRPRYGIGAATAGVSTPAALLASMSVMAGSGNDGIVGSFTVTPGAGQYGWAAFVSSASSSGVTFTDSLGTGGWQGATSPGNNTTDPGTSPNTSTVTFTDSNGTNWRFFRQNYAAAGGSFSTGA